jgi:predicted acylesterase/phospholipase RssA
MGIETDPASVTSRWWEDSTVVAHRLAGVFEGGGAKGVTYIGALRATLKLHAWFGSVAGASAGAITATLIAAGLTIDELGSETATVFDHLTVPSISAGLSRLRNNFGYLDTDGVRVWLETLLRRQVERYGEPPAGSVTFSELYAATGIELIVVAADVSRGRQVVFSAFDSPGTQVAEAVLASSSIPFAFAPRELLVPGPAGPRTHTVVDGGVWQNFPMFLYRDRSFRRWSGRPESIAEQAVVGFLLDEHPEERLDVAGSRFVPLDDSADAVEWSRPPAGHQSRPSLANRAAALALDLAALPFRFAQWLSTGNAPALRGRWGEPRSPAERLAAIFDAAFGALSSGLFALLAAGILVVGSFLALRWMWESFIVLRAEEIYFDLAFGEFTSASTEVVQVVGVAIAMVLVLVLAALLICVLAVNYVALGPLRHLMVGTARTFVAGPGAPAWAGSASDDHVMRLPIPSDLTTFSFKSDLPKVRAAIERAIADSEAVTLRDLPAALQGPAVQTMAARPGVDVVGAPAVAPPSSPQPGFGMMSARLAGVALAGTTALMALALILPKPAFRRFDANIRVCAAAIAAPEDTCDAATPATTVVTALFGPAAGGHETEVRMMVGDRIVGSADRMVNDPRGRITSASIDWGATCGFEPCTLVIEAVVDDQVAFRREIRFDASVDSSH